MLVKAAPGLLCPMEGNQGQIDDKTPVEVADDSLYYNRLIADGSLVPVKPKGGKNGK